MKKRATRFAGVVVVAALSVGSRCRQAPGVTFEVSLPSSMKATWIEVGVFPGSCPVASQLAGGIPPTGSVTRIAFKTSDASPPVGDLKKGKYAFEAVARADDCSVVASGCSTVDVTDARDVSVTLSATSQPAGACDAGESCVDARCVPTIDESDPSVGARCSLQVVGAGPLGDPLDVTGNDATSAPAVAVTESGFLVAYREYDSIAGAARLTVAAISTGGGISIPQATTLPGQCANQDESDAVGMGYANGSGVVVSTRPACGQNQPGLDMLSVSADGTVQKSAFTPSSTGRLTLSNAHAYAATGGGSGWLAYVDQGAAAIIGVKDLATSGAPTPIGDVPPHTLAMVAASTSVLAALAAGSGTSPDAGPIEGGGGEGPTLRLQLGTSPSNLAQPIDFPGSRAAIAARGSRATVLSDSTTASRPFAWRMFDLGSQSATVGDSFAPPAPQKIVAGDVAVQGDHAFFAIEHAGAISIVALDHATTQPTPLREFVLSDDTRVPRVSTLRDGRIAIAASDSRVLVAWITAKTIGPNDPLGGYAVLACTP